MSPRPIASVGVVVWRADEVLLIKRGKPPFMGHWSIPGGKVELGETLHQAVLRELAEETGIQAEIAGLVDVFESITEHGHYLMIDYVARWTSGRVRPGDDAADAAFVPAQDALARVAWDQTRQVLEASRKVLDGHDLARMRRQN